MERSDFGALNIRHFTPEEVEGTGAKLSDVNFELIVRLEKFRDLIGRVVVLLPNGLTTGEHKSEWHRKGMAVDIAFREEDGAVDIQEIFICALQAGYTGIGIYFNETAYSFHFDLRPAYSFWRGMKKHRADNWDYSKLISI